jgi:hypothetical protein
MHVDGYYTKYCEISYQHPFRCPADATTNLGGQKPSSGPTSIEGVIEARLYRALVMSNCPFRAYISEDAGCIQA